MFRAGAFAGGEPTLADESFDFVPQQIFSPVGIAEQIAAQPRDRDQLDVTYVGPTLADRASDLNPLASGLQLVDHAGREVLRLDQR
jgi:hypothetical protein